MIAVRPIGCNGGVTGDFARIAPTPVRHRESLRPAIQSSLGTTFLDDHLPFRSTQSPPLANSPSTCVDRLSPAAAPTSAAILASH